MCRVLRSVLDRGDLALDGEQLTGEVLKRMIVNATSVLRDNRSIVDALNVFPVPDGDTGTNMSLTMLSARDRKSTRLNSSH